MDAIETSAANGESPTASGPLRASAPERAVIRMDWYVVNT